MWHVAQPNGRLAYNDDREIIIGAALKARAYLGIGLSACMELADCFLFEEKGIVCRVTLGGIIHNAKSSVMSGTQRTVVATLGIDCSDALPRAYAVTALNSIKRKTATKVIDAAQDINFERQCLTPSEIIDICRKHGLDNDEIGLAILIRELQSARNIITCIELYCKYLTEYECRQEWSARRASRGLVANVADHMILGLRQESGARIASCLERNNKISSSEWGLLCGI